MKEMGAVMKNVMARFSGAGIRVDGKASQRRGEAGVEWEMTELIDFR